MRIVKKIAKWILRVFLIVVGLLLLVCVLVYIPPIQNFIKDKASSYVSRNMGIQLEIERFRLRFPLTLAVDNTMLRTVQGDTLLQVGELKAGVALFPLLTGTVEVNSFVLGDAAVDYSDSTGSLAIRGGIGRLGLDRVRVKLSQNDVKIGGITLADANIDLSLGESEAADTTAASTDTIPWKIEAGKLNIDRLAFNMHTRPDVTELSVVLPTGRIAQANIDLAMQTVDARSVTLSGGHYTYLTDTVAVAGSAADTIPKVQSRPWVVNVGRVELKDNAGTYGTLYARPQAGFDPSYIAVTGLDLRVDSLYNRSSDISLRLSELELKERSGLEVTGADGRFAMDSGGVRLAGFRLTTAASSIEADISAGAGIMTMDPQTALSATIDASLGSSDLFLFYPADAQLRRTLGGKDITASGEFDGRLADMDINALKVEMPSHIALTANGNVRSVTDPAQLAGEINLEGRFTDIGFVKDFLPDSTRNRIGFPHRLALSGKVSVDKGVYAPNLRIKADSGYVDIRGRADIDAQSYEATLAAVDFPLHSFLPADSLGLLSLEVNAGGHGFDFANSATVADAQISISRFDYKGFDHRNITLTAKYADNRLAGNLTGDNDALQLDLDLGGTLTSALVGASVKGRIGKADVMAMRLSDTPLEASGVLDISAEAARDTTQIIYSLDATIDSVRFTHGDHFDRVAKTTITAKADRSSATAKILTGDFSLNFNAPSSIKELAGGFTQVADTLMRQLAERNIDFRPVEDIMPTFTLDVKAGCNNVLHSLMTESGMDFGELTVGAYNTAQDPFRVRGLATSVNTGGLMLDTLNLGLGLRNDVLTYFLRLANRPGNIEQLALIYLYGTVKGDHLTANFNQRNRDGEKGFVFGIDAQLRDSSIRATLFPQDPLFAYEKWSLNPDNYIEYCFDNRIYANLELEGQLVGPEGRSHVMLKSVDYENMPPGSVRLDIAHLKIGRTLDLLPAPPPIDGLLDANVAFGMKGAYIAANGSAGVTGLTYEQQKVGDVSVIAMTNSNDNGVWDIDLGLTINENSALTARGTYDMEGPGGMNLDVGLPTFPLSVANPFIPDGTVALAGDLHGNAKLTGTTDKLNIDGSLNFTGGKLTVPMIGTTYGISDQPIRISRNRMRMRDFGLVAPNNELLAVDGTIDIGDFSNMSAALAISADNFRVVDAPRNRGSEVYGTADVDVDLTARGPLSELVLRGGMKVLRTTDVVYTMMDSPMGIEDQKQDIVTFISFADTTALAMRDSTVKVRTGGMDMLVNIDIEDDVEATVNLSDNGNDRIELVGGGNLAFTMSNQGDIRLTGRYALSGGTVVYNPPVISQKNFTIDPNSYVLWTGELAAPQFNIRAVEKLRTSVEGKGTVNFEVSILISGSLEDMQIAFDLSSDNTDIQYELASLAPEQRASEAMQMLIYNTYSGPGGSGKVDPNNPLNTFIEKELNQWARNSLRNVDVSFGIQSQEDLGGNQHTDYSYKVSKNLFNDRVKITIGGSISDNESAQDNLRDNFVDDISLEYRLTKRDNMFLKAYRYNTQESILEGEVVETGGGFLYRKKMERLRDLFKLNKDTRLTREQQREARRELREEEMRAVRDTSRWYNRGPGGDSIRRARRALRDSLRADSLNRLMPTRDSARFDSLGVAAPGQPRGTNGMPRRGEQAPIRPNREATNEETAPADNTEQ